MRVIIVAENASTRFGGEAILPWHYFRVMRRRGIDVRLVVHARTRDELTKLLPGEVDRMHFLPDTWFNRLTCRLSRFLPQKLGEISLGFLSRLSTQRSARRLVRQLVAMHGTDIVHQPIPVSPREPSLMHGVGAPVLIGPMNGNMSYPPGVIKEASGRTVGAIVSLGRMASGLLHRLMPGKLRAAALLVANPRTRDGLPGGTRGEVIELVENGVDLELWSAAEPTRHTPGGPIRVLFVGRLIDWKAVDVLLDAFARLHLPAQLEILGDGPMRAALEEQARRLGIADRVAFAGWQPQRECARRLQQADVLVLPSLYECGGAVVLEAMACGLPVVATDWGGPADYLDSTCGILVPPTSRDALVAGFAAALGRLAVEPELRAKLGQAGRKRARSEFDWEVKVDRMLEIYRRFAIGT
jgi:glycosyltransferase involved in cell wall biosynthesis